MALRRCRTMDRRMPIHIREANYQAINHSTRTGAPSSPLEPHGPRLSLAVAGTAQRLHTVLPAHPVFPRHLGSGRHALRGIARFGRASQVKPSGVGPHEYARLRPRAICGGCGRGDRGVCMCACGGSGRSPGADHRWETCTNSPQSFGCPDSVCHGLSSEVVKDVPNLSWRVSSCGVR